MSWEGKATEGDNVSWEGGAHVSREGRLCKSRENHYRRMMPEGHRSSSEICALCVYHITLYILCVVCIFGCVVVCACTCTLYMYCVCGVCICVYCMCVSIIVLCVCYQFATQAITMVCVGYN